MSDRVSLSPVEVAAFNSIQRQFNNMIREIIEHRAEDASKRWQLVISDGGGFLVAIDEKSEPSE